MFNHQNSSILNSLKNQLSRFQIQFLFRTIRYFGDLESDDMDDVKKGRLCFRIARKTISRQREKIRQLQRSNRRLRSRINTLKSLTQHLRNNNMISENAECTLNVSCDIISLIEVFIMFILYFIGIFIWSCKRIIQPNAQETWESEVFT